MAALGNEYIPDKYRYHPISQVRKPRHREVTQLALGHTTGGGQSPDSDPELVLPAGSCCVTWSLTLSGKMAGAGFEPSSLPGECAPGFSEAVAPLSFLLKGSLETYAHAASFRECWGAEELACVRELPSKQEHPPAHSAPGCRTRDGDLRSAIRHLFAPSSHN